MKEQMVVEGGKENDTNMDRDLEEVEQKQYDNGQEDQQ